MRDTGSDRSAQDLRSDTRGVTPVIGVVLLVAVGTVLLAVLQVTVVPKLNAQHEFEHNQRVQRDVVRLAATVDRVAATGTGETVPVEVGLRYPSRLVFLNPPPVSDRLRITEERTVTIANARASGETGDYWDGSTRTFQTRAIVYEPDYNEWDSAPTTVYEPWAVYNRQEGATVPQTETVLVDGREISLVALDGRPTRATAGTVGVTVQPVSAPVRTVTVRNGSDPIRITVPTDIRRDAWRDLLADELDPDGTDDDRYVTGLRCSQSPPGPCGELTLTLEPGTYELRLGKVAVGGGVDEPGAAYLTDVADPKAVSDGATTAVRVAVRDRFDNPVSGVDVRFSSPDGSFDTPVVTSGDDGRATAQFTPDSSGTVTITATADLNGDGTIQAEERVTLTRDVVGSGGGGGGGGGETVGTGGIEQWTTTDTTATFSQEGGLWRGIDGASRLVLSNARFTPVRPSDQQFVQGKEYLRFVLVFTRGDTQYVYEFTTGKDGVVRSAGGAWGNTEVTIWRKVGDTTYERVGSPELSATALESLYQGTDGMDLLASSSYTGRVDSVAQLRNWLGSTQDVEVYVTDMDGRVTIAME
ncbi:MAG: Ig-like domain-containing protein [Halorientalis sp.]